MHSGELLSAAETDGKGGLILTRFRDSPSFCRFTRNTAFSLGYVESQQSHSAQKK